MEPYAWVSTGSIAKFNRAVLEFKNKNKQLVAQGKEAEEITEEKLKARYIEMAGLIMETDEGSAEEPEEVEGSRRTKKSK